MKLLFSICLLILIYNFTVGMKQGQSRNSNFPRKNWANEKTDREVTTERERNTGTDPDGSLPPPISEDSSYFDWKYYLGYILLIILHFI